MALTFLPWLLELQRPSQHNAEGFLGLQKWLPNYDRVSVHTEEWSELFLRGGGSLTLVSRAQHFPSNLYPYVDHTHQQRPMPTHVHP
jgi:hypothetical protein